LSKRKKGGCVFYQELSRSRRRKIEVKKKKDYIQNYKSKHSCQICGENQTVCLSFHHRDPEEKRFTIHSAAAKRYGMKSIKEEISKCDILCLNCHSKLHKGLITY